MVPPSSDRIARVPPYSSSREWSFRVRGCHPVPLAFPDHSTNHTHASGLFPVRSPLLRESRLISVPRGTEMFQFPRFASHPYGFRVRYLAHTRWVSPFGHPRINVCLPTPRGFSQATTSFIASDRQGIHRLRLFT